MKKPMSPATIVVSIVALLAVIGVAFVYLSGGSKPPSTNADERILEALEKNGGNAEKLDPELRKLYDEGVKSGRYKSGGASASGAAGQPAGLPSR